MSWWPFCGIGAFCHQDTEIDVDWERRQFAIRYVGDYEPNSILDVGQGHFGFFERYVFSLFIIP